MATIPAETLTLIVLIASLSRCPCLAITAELIIVWARIYFGVIVGLMLDDILII